MPDLSALKPKPHEQPKEKLTPAKKFAGIRVRKAGELESSLNMIFYGVPKIGKSTLAASAHEVPSLRPVLVIDLEAGSLTLKYDYPDIDVVPLTSWHSLAAAYQDLAKDDHYRTVIIDNLSEANKLAMLQILAQGVRDSDRDKDPDVAELRDYGKGRTQTERMVRWFRDLNKNVIFIAWANTDKDENNRRFTGPMLPGKLSKEIPGYLDYVLYMYKVYDKKDDSLKRVVLTDSTDRTIAGGRTGKKNPLPQVIEDPTMGKIFSYLEGDKQ